MMAALLASAAALALSLSAPSPAKAEAGFGIPGGEGIGGYIEMCQAANMAIASVASIASGAVGVIFGGNQSTETTQVINTLNSSYQRICAYKTQLNQYRAAARTLNSVMGSRDGLSALRRLGGASRTYLPNGRVARGALSGRDSYGRSGEFLHEDRYSRPENIDGSASQDEWQERMDRQEQATANMKAILADGMDDIEDRIHLLEDLAGTLNKTKDVNDAAVLNNAIQTSAQNLKMHEIQLMHINAMMQAQDRVDKQQQGQYMMESIVNFEKSMVNLWGGTINR